MRPPRSASNSVRMQCPIQCLVLAAHRCQPVRTQRCKRVCSTWPWSTSKFCRQSSHNAPFSSSLCPCRLSLSPRLYSQSRAYSPRPSAVPQLSKTFQLSERLQHLLIPLYQHRKVGCIHPRQGPAPPRHAASLRPDWKVTVRRDNHADGQISRRPLC